MGNVLGAVFKIILVAVLLAYPVFVYFGLSYIEVKWLGLCLLLALIARALTLPPVYRGRIWAFIAIGMIIAVLSAIYNNPLSLKLYPIMMSVLMLFIFAASLYRPPTVIETFARLHYKDDLPIHVIHYTRNVTKLWCGFFILNAAIASATVFSSFDIWVLYNGFLSYILAGSLFALEFLYRHCVVEKRHKIDDA